MDRDRIGEIQVLAVLKVVFHAPSVEVYRQRLAEGIDLPDNSDVSVEYSLSRLNGDAEASAELPDEIIIVPDLHHLIAEPKESAVQLLLRLLSPRGIQLRLKKRIQPLYAERPLPLGRHDLDGERVRLQIGGKLLQKEPRHRLRDLLRTPASDEEKVP